MINKKQLVTSQKVALVFILGHFILKLIHFSSLSAGISTLFAIFHIWALLVILIGILFYHMLLTCIFYLSFRILNYTFNLIYR
ncbi:hypothetical protein Lacidipiscis_02335 [Ligilactobacillus acidipiscis]|mgnify:CR=1 FL=1|jgi:hypothetical protein|uniref:Uncharacterized protein n=1 Tax=Ligilactobacillus acidipiscis TaxID=89059 RepID=A0A1K1KS51_9LACO|nr:hypothetical protein Lacidipiscis_02335 [Ligilactobacillus acidipiscis]SFV40292.1 hypothetical protein LAC1533_0872 [Ligilactobacillus acidipiscis]